MISSFKQLLEGMLSEPHRVIGDLPLLTPSETVELLDEWNKDQRQYGTTDCLHTLVEKQARIQPDKIAVVFEDQKLTYGELDIKANELADRLIARGVGPEVRVGLLFDRGLEMAIAILAVAKSGGVYVPLDPNVPEQRLVYILNDAQVMQLLCDRELGEKLNWDGPRIHMEPEPPFIAESKKRRSTMPENAAYLIYTSGSTGNPKGVVISHANVTRLFQATNELFRFDTSDVAMFIPTRSIFRFGSIGTVWPPAPGW